MMAWLKSMHAGQTLYFIQPIIDIQASWPPLASWQPPIYKRVCKKCTLPPNYYLTSTHRLKCTQNHQPIAKSMWNLELWQNQMMQEHLHLIRNQEQYQPTIQPYFLQCNGHSDSGIAPCSLIFVHQVTTCLPCNQKITRNQSLEQSLKLINSEALS